MAGEGKREFDEIDKDNDDDDWVGPMPAEAVKVKKRKGKQTISTIFDHKKFKVLQH